MRHYAHFVRGNAMQESFVNKLIELRYNESCVKTLTFLSVMVDKFLKFRVLSIMVDRF